MELTAISEYGGLGVAILVVFLSFTKDKQVLKMFSNHMNHNTKALEKLCGVIDRVEKQHNKK